jgi:hypothetical protein
LLSLHHLRTQLQQARTRLAKVSAAPDRRRRRQWAQEWIIAHGAAAGCAVSPDALAKEGFSQCQLDERMRNILLSDWSALKASRSQRAANSPGPKSTGKVFLEEVLSDDDLRSFPAFVATAIDERVLMSVMETLGMAPHLESVDVLASRHTGKELTASQLWHYDINDKRIMKLFVYLEDCWTSNGPFTFIPADRSQRVSNIVGHYVDDEHIAAHVPREQWRVVEGRAGTAFLIDTGRCYHFGSRSEQTRYAYVATYSSGLKFMRRSKMWRDVLGSRADGLSALQRAVCGLEQ